MRSASSTMRVYISKQPTHNTISNKKLLSRPARVAGGVPRLEFHKSFSISLVTSMQFYIAHTRI